MTRREKLQAIRRAMDIGAAALDDAAALTAVALYRSWRSGVDYAVGDMRRYEETLYRCLTAHTSQDAWTPDVSPSLWVRISDPSEEWPEWVQPMASTDAYKAGDKVSHAGKHWISGIDANVWEPGVYGWTEHKEDRQ